MSPERSSAPSILPSQSLSSPSQISTPPLVRSHWYSQPVAYELSRSQKHAPGPEQSHASISHCVLASAQGMAPELTHFDTAWSALHARPHLPQSTMLVQRSTSSSFTPSQSSSFLLQIESSFADLTQ